MKKFVLNDAVKNRLTQLQLSNGIYNVSTNLHTRKQLTSVPNDFHSINCKGAHVQDSLEVV